MESRMLPSPFNQSSHKKFLRSFLVASSLSAPAFSENLIQVYQHAKQNDIQLKISETNYLATLEKKPQIQSALKHRIDLSADASYNLQYSGRTARGQDGSAFANLGYNLSLSKPLINKGLDAQVAQVDASILQAKAALDIDRQNLIVRVADAYFST